MKNQFAILTAAALAVSTLQVHYSSAQTWVELSKVIASDRAVDDQFGSAVSIDGNFAVVGAPIKDASTSLSAAGEAYVFEKVNGNWIEIQTLIPTTRVEDGLFGTSVAIRGSYIVVGSYFDGLDASDSNFKLHSGSATIFKRDAVGVWQNVQKIVASDRGGGEYFGRSVAISGDRLIIGAPGDADSLFGGSAVFGAGSAYIFERNSSGLWIEKQKIVAFDRAVSDKYGTSVSISGNYLVVSAPMDDKDELGGNLILNAGSIYLYQRDGNGTWVFEKKLVASDRIFAGNLGGSISLTDDYLISGSMVEAAYIFEKNGADDWLETQKITSSDTRYDDNFGISVCIDNMFAVVGANYEDEDASGLNPFNAAGSAYIFERGSTGIWTETCKVVNSDRNFQDNFGIAVAISGSYTLIGANLEDDDVSGDNAINKAGSAYFFAASNIGVDEISSSIYAKAYPNPTSSRITIDLGNNFKGTSCKIVNMIGETIAYATAGSQLIDINLSGSDGIYFVEIINKAGDIAVLKVVKRN